LVTVMFLVSSAAVFVRPVVPLVVESFTDLNVELKSGVVFAAVALTSAVAAVVAGRIAGRTGYRNMLIVAAAGAGLAYIPVGAANNLAWLIMLMALVGVFSGAMIPMVNALIGASAPEGKHGSAFGLVGSAQALSFAIAPLLGGLTAQQLGIHAVFPVIGSVLIAVSGLVWLTVREPAAVAETDATAEPSTAASTPSR
jgi:DHA1 family multidrug resistance protein-like MFS transporter